MDKNKGIYKVWAEIDTDALRHNYRTVRETVRSHAPDCRVISVVKADAYGHGMEAVSRILLSEGCDFFAVSCVSEAAALRKAIGNRADILILGYSQPEDAETLIQNDIIQTVFSEEYARRLSTETDRLKAEKILSENERLRIHMKLDTGMNRLGFDTVDPERTADGIRKAAALPHLACEGMFTHFATADTDAGNRGQTAAQLARFDAVQSALTKTGDCPALCHLCNSAGSMYLPEGYKSAVRAGIILYGLSPSGEILPEYRPVMTLKTRIAHIHTLRAGESVSYGATFTADRDMRIATVPIGYGDGFLRHYKGGVLYLPDGTPAPIVGRICMDQCMIDVSGTDVQPGDVLTVFGGDDGTRMEALAQAGDTINYEITTVLTARVPRVLSDG